MPRWITEYLSHGGRPVTSEVEARSRDEAETLLERRGLREHLKWSAEEMASCPRLPRPSSLLELYLREPTEHAGLDLLHAVASLLHLAASANPELDAAALLAPRGAL